MAQVERDGTGLGPVRFARQLGRRWLMVMAPILGLMTERAMAGEAMRIYPAPAGEPLATNFIVSIGQQDVPVYVAEVGTLNPVKHVGGFIPQPTGFVSFDMGKPVEVTVTCPETITRAKIWPAARGITPVIKGNKLVFMVDKPGQLELDVNGDWLHSLQVFANPIETDAPQPNDPNVIYFGPGRHEVTDLVVSSGQTLYLAGGAVLYGRVPSGVTSRTGVTAMTETHGGAVISLKGDNIKLCGRGIIDGSLCPIHTRNDILVCGTNITLEGVVVRDSSTWTIPILCSEHVTVKNLKVFGWRGNSDGIDICNSRHVQVTDSFLRTEDDLVVLKTPVKGGGEDRDIRVQKCVLWNELAHALSMGAELRENVSDVRFTDCDIIHDQGREWLFRVYNCDSGRIHDITFDNLRVDEGRKLISLWIGSAKWSQDSERGSADDITFKNIHAKGPHLSVDLKGLDASHGIRDIRFQNVVVNGQPLKLAAINQNAFVQDIRVTP